ncbi:MAG: TRAP transporter small permease, partial [Clostridiales Family XIII bacterium]|nr:TRAP transporter small permease [Clostridiales Family XIII bacterium]
MRKFFQGVARVYDFVLNGIAVIISAVIILALGLACIQVVSRYTPSPILWTNDLLKMLMIVMGFPGAAWLLRHNKHVEIDIVATHMSPRARTVCHLVMSFVGVATCAIVTVIGIWVTV